MHALSVLFVIFVTILINPRNTLADATEGTEIEEPKTLPLKNEKGINEIWQEDVHEIVVRKSRGANKDNAGASGKKREKIHLRTTKIPKTNFNIEHEHIHSDPITTQSAPIVGKHHHKHKKMNHNKKHTNSSSTTTRPKQEQDKENSCRYTKSSWTDCDSKSNTRSRTLTLKKGDDSCVQTRTIQKKCKKPKSEKGCRYEKGTFSECSQPNGEMTRTDKLKSTSDSANCQQTRVITKKCNKAKQDKQPKGNSKEKKPKGERKNRQ